LEPLRFPEKPAENLEDAENQEEENLDPDAGKSQQQVMDELTGQQTLFSDEDYQ
jgi:topoisomerase-4 subunit A